MNVNLGVCVIVLELGHSFLRLEVSNVAST